MNSRNNYPHNGVISALSDYAEAELEAMTTSLSAKDIVDYIEHFKIMFFPGETDLDLTDRMAIRGRIPSGIVYRPNPEDLIKPKMIAQDHLHDLSQQVFSMEQFASSLEGLAAQYATQLPELSHPETTITLAPELHPYTYWATILADITGHEVAAAEVIKPLPKSVRRYGYLREEFGL